MPVTQFRAGAHFLCFVLLAAAAAAAGCSQRAVPSGSTAPVPAVASLPAVPDAAADARYAAMVDNDFALGSAFIDQQYAVADGTEAVLSGGSGAGFQAAWALYAIAARPATPYCITVNASYLDPSPLDSHEGEGYYVGIADYAQNTWEWSPPYVDIGQMRVFVPSSANVISGGGMIYVVVLAPAGNNARVARVEVGYSTGPGYEDHWLAAPQGEVAGLYNDIQLTPAGDVQIAYLCCSNAFVNRAGAHVRIARWAGGHWALQDIATPFTPNDVRFAIGANGYRSLLVQDAATDDLILLRDTGSGDFSNSDTLGEVDREQALYGITYINGADDPAGLLDTVLCTFAIPDVGDTGQSRYYCAPGAGGPGVFGDLLAGATRSAGRINLKRNLQNRGLVTVPTAPAFPIWSVSTGIYSAVADTWDFATLPPYAGLELAYDDSCQPSATAMQIPGLDYVIAHLDKDNAALNMASSADAWAFHGEYRIAGAFYEPFDIETFPDGRIGCLGHFGANSPVLITGSLGAGDWTRRYLSNSPFMAMHSSLAITNGGVCVVAAHDRSRGSLRYFRITDTEVSSAEIDSGGNATATTLGDCALVAVDDMVFAYYSDTAHVRLMYAVNDGGIWLREAMPLETTGYPYAVIDAGYLENTDTMWVAYLDAVTYGVHIASGSPFGAGWRDVVFSPLPHEGFDIAIEDDETNIGLISYSFSPEDDTYAFMMGPPETGPQLSESVAPTEDLLDFPLSLAYDRTRELWGVASTDEDEHYAYYFERQAPGFWVGPYTITQELGAAGEVQVGGLSYAAGVPMVTVSQHPDASTIWNINVYTGGAGFHFTSQPVAAFDTTAVDFGMCMARPGPDGQPVLCVGYKNLGDICGTAAVYVPDAGGYTTAYTWGGLVSEIPDGSMGVDMAVNPAGQAIISLVEHAGSSPNFGRGVIHFPW